MHNYFIVATKLQDSNAIKTLLPILKGKGFMYKYYKYSIDNYIDSQHVSKYLKLYNNTDMVKIDIDSNYIHILDSLVNVDQNSNKYLRSINKGILNDYGKDSLDKIGKANLIFMKDLFIKKFPSDLFLGSQFSPLYVSTYNVIMIHNGQLGNYHYLDSIYYYALCQGLIDPSEFDAYCHYYAGGNSNDQSLSIGDKKIKATTIPYDLVEMNDSLFQYQVPDSIVSKINENRKLILGLCNAHNLRKKMVYQYLHQEYNFINSFIIKLNANTIPKRIKDKLIFIGTRKHI